MKVLVTGSNGFIGKNLIAHLREIKDIEIVTFEKEDDFEKIEQIIDSISIVFHLAGINRPKEVEEFYEGNSKLTEKMISLLKQKNRTIPFVLTSSIQADLDNDYGKSKKSAEEQVIQYGQKGYIYRLHNVFGKWCRPNYNSVVATYCYNIANNLDIMIHDPSKEIELVYIDDVCQEFIKLLNGSAPTNKENQYCYIEPRYKVTLNQLSEKLYAFKKSMESIYVPATGDDFTKKLYATYVSYLPLEKVISNISKNTDERGSFTELIRTLECGQFSISTSKPGVIRGNHYHHTKMERFIVVKGKAKIRFLSIIDDREIEFDVSDQFIQAITIPVGFTHSIENVGDGEMMMILWCNELFDKEKPDTYSRPI